MKKLRAWYRDILWGNLPLLFLSVAVLCILCFLSDPADHFTVAHLRNYGVILCATDIFLCSICYKVTERGIYATLAGIPYRFIPIEKVSSLCIAKSYKTILIITLGDIIPYSAYKKNGTGTVFSYRLRHPFKTVIVHYTTRNAAILSSFLGKPFDKGDSAV